MAIPDDIDDSTLDKASGVDELPRHIAWSEPSLTYDLKRRADRLRVYEQVLREGTEDDVRYYVDVEELTRVFDELVLPLRPCRVVRMVPPARAPRSTLSAESVAGAGRAHRC